MRRIVIGLLAVGLALLPAVSAVSPASARAEDEPIRPKVESGWKFSASYDPMLVNDASSADHEPPTCETVPWCTLILIEPEFPISGYDPEADEWIMDVGVYWDAKPIVEGTAQGNDLDIYVYTYEDTLQDDGTYEKEYREVNRSAAAQMPETMKLFGTTPDNPTLYMVVYNYIGTNLGFRVDASVKRISYDDPDSYLDLGSPPPGGGSSGSGSSAGDDTGSGDGFSPFVPSDDVTPRNPSELSPTAPLLPVPSAGGGAVLTPSEGFAEGLGDFRDLADEIAATPGGAGILDRIRNRTVAAPEDVPGAVLVFWLVVAPIALVAAAFVMFLRRRPAALRL